MTRPTLLLAAILGLAATQAISEVACPHDNVSVIADPEVASNLCELTSRAIDELARCSLQIERTIQIELVDTLPDGCVGQYHCQDGRIELLSQDGTSLSLVPGGSFSAIDPDEYFYSILVHELTHAALESMPCPFESCVASQEYVAYAMQMRSYSVEARSAVLTRSDFDRPMTTDEINGFILLMAPDIFIQKAWRHFTQQDDPCGFVGEVISGGFLFDSEMP